MPKDRTDGELFHIIRKGDMPPEGDRVKDDGLEPGKLHPVGGEAKE